MFWFIIYSFYFIIELIISFYQLEFQFGNAECNIKYSGWCIYNFFSQKQWIYLFPFEVIWQNTLKDKLKSILKNTFAYMFYGLHHVWHIRL